MMSNATILRIDTPAEPDQAGNVTYTTGDTVALRCMLDNVNQNQRWEIGAAISKATLTLRVLKTTMPARPAQGTRLVIQGDDWSQSENRLVVYCNEWQPPKGRTRLAHWEVFLREETTSP